VQDTGHHWGQQVRWEFGTLIVYNESNGAIFNEMELVSLTGSIVLGERTRKSAPVTHWMDRLIRKKSLSLSARLATARSVWLGFSKVT
jgi:hypothetical protein